MGGDDDDIMAKAKRLVAKARASKLQNAFAAWKELQEFEQSIQTVVEVLEPIAELLEKKASDRSQRDTNKIVPLIAKVKAYSGLDPHVQAFIAHHVTLDLIWESIELPRNQNDAEGLFSIIGGIGMNGIVCDQKDPQLMALAQMAARQLMSSETEEEKTTKEKKTSRFALEAEISAEGSVTTPRRGNRGLETLATFNLNSRFNDKKVTTRLWRTIIDIIRSGQVPGQTASLQALASRDFDSLLSQRGPLTISIPSQALRSASTSALSPAAAAAGNMPSMSFRSSSFDDGASVGGPAVQEMRLWDSFSGRDLDCNADIGSVQTCMKQMPVKLQGCVTVPNSVTALLVISRAVFKQAVEMQQAILVRNAVDMCCRLPFLRHMPLKELFKLSKHLETATFSKGQTILKQGRGNTSVFFLIEGEVELVVDVPLTADKEVLMASLAHLGDQKKRSSIRSRRSTGQAFDDSRSEAAGSEWTDGSETDTGEMQRVVLGRRGPGCILGDEITREKSVVITVVALSPEVVTLTTSALRFMSSLDAMTQRLFLRLRPQMGSVGELGHAIADATARQLLVERCRSEVIVQSYQGTQKGVPSTLPVGGGTAVTVAVSDADQETSQKAEPWRPGKGEDSFFSQPISISAGERVMAAGGSIAEVVSGSGPLASSDLGTSRQKKEPSSTNLASANGMPGGVSVDRFQGMPSSKSLNGFLQIVKGVVVQRQEELYRYKKRELQNWDRGLDNCSNPSVVKKLDISGVLGGSGSQIQYRTEMLEAACVAIVRIEQLDGQASGALELLAEALDDTIVVWNQCARRYGLTLIRWESHVYYLIGGIDPGGQGKRPMVRVVADVLLEMRDIFNDIMAKSEVPLNYFFASLAIGAIFSSSDSSQFLVNMTGRAFLAACTMADEATEAYPCGAIIVSDAVSQALGRTHEMKFSGSGYLLLRKVELPFGCSFETVFGKAHELDPVSNGNPKANMMRIQAQKSSHFGDNREGFSLDDGLAVVYPLQASSRTSNAVMSSLNKSLPTVLKSETDLNRSRARFDRDEDFPQGPLKGSLKGRNTTAAESAAEQSPSARFDLEIQIPNPLSSRRRLKDPALAGSPKFSSPDRNVKRSTNLRENGSGSSQQQQQQQGVSAIHRTIAQPTTLEPRMDTTRNLRKREALSCKSPMGFRQQLRAELDAIRTSKQQNEEEDAQFFHSSSWNSNSFRTQHNGSFKSLASNDSIKKPQESSLTTGLGGSSVAPVPANLYMSLEDVVNKPIINIITPYSPSKPGVSGVAPRARPIVLSSLAKVEPPHEDQGRLSSLKAGEAPPSPPSRPRSPGPHRRASSPTRLSSPVPSRAASPAGGSGQEDRLVFSAEATLSAHRQANLSPGTSPPVQTLATSPIHPTSSSKGRTVSTSDKAMVATNYGPVPITTFDSITHKSSGILVDSRIKNGGSGGGKARQASWTHSASTARSPATYWSAPDSPLHPSHALDPVMGLSSVDIHRQAVTTWKDLGSAAAAAEYIRNLNQGVVNISFSTSGLCVLPDLGRLPFLESVAACFNTFVDPASITNLSTLPPYLKVLNLGHCQISALPKDIGTALPNITELNLSHNLLTSLPHSILTSCLQLKSLSMEHNLLPNIPSAFSRLVNLEQAFFAHNQIEDIFDHTFKGMKQLSLIDVSHNLLQQLPGILAGLPGLRTLLANSNALDEVPPGLLVSATGLEHLELRENLLSRCPEVTGFSLEEIEAFNRMFNPVESDDSEEEKEEDETPRGSLRHQSSSMGQRRRSSMASGSMSLGQGRSVSITGRMSITGSTSIRGSDASGTGPLKSMASMHRRSSTTLRRMSTMAGGRGLPGGGGSGRARRGEGSSGDGLLFEDEEQKRPESPTKPSRTPCMAATEAAMEYPDCVRLPQLRVLDLSGNQLLAVPPWLPPGLTALFMASNKIASIPDWVATRLVGLQLLDFHSNKIEYISRDLSRLTSLNLAAVQENPCTDRDSHGAEGTGSSDPDWLSEHVLKLKYQARVDGMNALGGKAKVDAGMNAMGGQTMGRLSSLAGN